MTSRLFCCPGSRWSFLRVVASLAIAFFFCEFLWLLDTLAFRPDAYRAALECLSTPGAVALNIATFAASLLHAFAWFPKRLSWIGLWVVINGLVTWWAVR